MKDLLKWYFENATCGNREKCIDDYEATYNQLLACEMIGNLSLLNIDMQLNSLK